VGAGRPAPEQASNTAFAADAWENAERAAAAAGEPVGRAGLAAPARAALAHDGGWGLIQEAFGPIAAIDPSGDQATPDT
jgi:hypothetical protein